LDVRAGGPEVPNPFNSINVRINARLRASSAAEVGRGWEDFIE
jgi:hypothetical protein